MAVEFKLLHSGDGAALATVAPDVFDNPINEQSAEEFLNDPRHHLAVAIENGLVVGFASAVHYIHPDKPPELWINEVGVASAYRARGLGKALLSTLFEAGRKAGCSGAWVLTDKANVPARRLYSSLGGVDSDQVMFEFKFEGGKTASGSHLK